MRENGDPLKYKHSLSDEICEYVHSRSKEKKTALKKMNNLNNRGGQE
jgi:hypothetical protein